MNLLKTLKSNRGSITIFFTIISLAIVGVFIFTSYIYGKEIAKNSGINYLKIAENDLLLSVDKYILENYGLACYDSKRGVSVLRESITNNCKINKKNSIFYSIKLKENDENNILYEKVDDISNNKILQYQILKASKYNGLREFADWFLKKIEITKNMEKEMEKFSYASKLSNEIDKILGYKKQLYKYLEKISKDHLNEILDIRYFAKDDLSKFYGKINILKRENQQAINIIDKIEEKNNQLLYVLKNSNYKDLKEEKNLNYIIDEMELKLRNSNRKNEFRKHKSKLLKNISLINKIKKESINSKKNSEEFDVIRYFENYEIDYGISFNQFDENNYLGIIDKIIDYIRDKNYIKFIKNIDFKNEFKISENNLSPYEIFFIDEYILGTFQKNINSTMRDFKLYKRDERSSNFSKNEVEYILTGNSNEIKSKIEVKWKIFLIREGMNIVAIFSDKEKMNIILEISESFGSFFPPAGPATMIILTGVWATLESIYDLEEIYKGKGIPIIKTPDDWVISLNYKNKDKYEEILVEKKKEEKKEREEIEDFYYNDYLRIFLFFLDNNDKFFRIKKIIEENYSEINLEKIDLNDYAVSHKIRAKYNMQVMFFKENIDKNLEISGGY